jgi:hypothetical protein
MVDFIGFYPVMVVDLQACAKFGVVNVTLSRAGAPDTPEPADVWRGWTALK